MGPMAAREELWAYSLSYWLHFGRCILGRSQGRRATLLVIFLHRSHRRSVGLVVLVRFLCQSRPVKETVRAKLIRLET